jgi:N-acetylneuraminate synthase
MEMLKIGGRVIGPNTPPYNIAEIGSNHNGDMDLCRRMIDAAVECGVDAVKFQSWSKKSLISRAEFARHTEYSDKKRHFGSLEEMVERYQLTRDQHKEIASYCRDRGMTFLSSGFSPEEIDLLESLGVLAHKIASMDINHHSLLEYAAGTGKPIILSTGMSSLSEIGTAVDILRSGGAKQIALLHCVSIYPPKYKDINLRNISMLQQAFDVPVGFSDHTIGTAIPLAAIALGACLIEKHFTIDKGLEGWDHWISADPEELKTIVEEGLAVFTSLGSTVRRVNSAEMDKRKVFRRCLIAKKNLLKGDRLKADDVDFKRPGTGIHPDELPYVVGRVLARDVLEESELQWSDFV